LIFASTKQRLTCKRHSCFSLRYEAQQCVPAAGTWFCVLPNFERIDERRNELPQVASVAVKINLENFSPGNFWIVVQMRKRDAEVMDVIAVRSRIGLRHSPPALSQNLFHLERRLAGNRAAEAHS
jgi:hypothetical protein